MRAVTAGRSMEWAACGEHSRRVSSPRRQSTAIRGLLYGNVDQFIHQVIAVAASVSYSFVVTLILITILDKTIGMTVKNEEEYVGLDISQHGERAFS